MTFEMDHIVINAVEIETMLHFYMHVLDLSGERVGEFRNNNVPFPSVRLTEDTIIDIFPKSLWEKTSPQKVCRPNLNHLCLSTDRKTWKLLQTRLAENNIPIDVGPVKRWGAHGSGTSIYFRDPEENIIEVRYYEQADSDRPCLLKS